MFAQVTVDIAHSNVDKCFTYAIPEGLAVCTKILAYLIDTLPSLTCFTAIILVEPTLNPSSALPSSLKSSACISGKTKAIATFEELDSLLPYMAVT